MDDARYRRLLDLLLEAEGLNPAARGRLLDQECAADPQLRREVEEHLALEGKAIRLLGPTTFIEDLEDRAPPRKACGQRIPAFRNVLHDEPLLKDVPEIEGFKVLPPCVLYDRIGVGGMGAVFRARHLDFEMDVAVKCMLLQGSVSTKAMVARLRREAQAAALVNHQNLVRVFAVDSRHGVHFIVMEYVEGETARDRVVRKGPLPPAEATAILLGAARGLSAAHQEGIVHRDIKPDNMLISRRGGVKVVDLGLAAVRPGPDREPTAAGRLTGIREIIGTPSYMPPEQWKGIGEVGPPGDVWALGATFFFLLAGVDALPERGYLPEKPDGEEDFPDIREVRPEVPEDLAAIIARCTARSPADRYPTARGLFLVLKGAAERNGFRYLADPPPPASPSRPPARLPPSTEVIESIRNRTKPRPRRGLLLKAPRRRGVPGLAIAAGSTAVASLLVFLVHPEVIDRWKSHPPVRLTVESPPAGARVGSHCSFRGTVEGAPADEVRVEGTKADLEGERWNVTLDLPDGNRTVTVEALASGRPIASLERAVSVDFRPPGITVLYPTETDAVPIEEREIDVHIAVVDDSGVQEVVIAGQPAEGPAGSETFSRKVPLASEGETIVEVKAHDGVGNKARTAVKLRPDGERRKRTVAVEGSQPDPGFGRRSSLAAEYRKRAGRLREEKKPREALEAARRSLKLGDNQETRDLVQELEGGAPEALQRSFSISRPKPGEIRSASRVTVEGTVPAGAKATVRPKGKGVAGSLVVTAGRFEGTVEVGSDGKQTIVLEAVDENGVTVEASVEVILDSAPPRLTWNEPAAAFSGPLVYVEGTVEDQTEVTVKVNGSDVRRRGSSWWTWVLMGADDLVLHAEARDAAGNIATLQREGKVPDLEPDRRRIAKESLHSEGGGNDTEAAVRAALGWLARHQEEDGGWKARDFTRRCARGRCDGAGLARNDVGVTGLALLAFSGAGHTHVRSDREEFRECVRKGIRFLLMHQSRPPEAEPGRFADVQAEEKGIYGQAIATLAMADVMAAAGNDPSLAGPVREGIRFCLAARNPESVWRYRTRSGDNDTAVTGWMVSALHAARECKIAIEGKEDVHALQDALGWFDWVTNGEGAAGYQSPPGRGSRFQPAMTAEALFGQLLCGRKPGDREVRPSVQRLAAALPRWEAPPTRRPSTVDFYYWYHGTCAMFQVGGESWRSWSKDLKGALLPHQRRGDIEEDGSWDPVDEWGPEGGRIYSTALAALCLETYYRSPRMRR